MYEAFKQASVLERCADELEEQLEQNGRELLTLHQAAMESGYSESHLRRLVKDGHLSDRADKGPKMVRRGDLPRKVRRDSTVSPICIHTKSS